MVLQIQFNSSRCLHLETILQHPCYFAVMNEVDNSILSAFEDNDIERRFVADCNEVIHFKLGLSSHELNVYNIDLIYYLYYSTHFKLFQFAARMILSRKKWNFNLKCRIKYSGKRKLCF